MLGGAFLRRPQDATKQLAVERRVFAPLNEKAHWESDLSAISYEAVLLTDETAVAILLASSNAVSAEARPSKIRFAEIRNFDSIKFRIHAIRPNSCFSNSASSVGVQTDRTIDMQPPSSYQAATFCLARPVRKSIAIRALKA